MRRSLVPLLLFPALAACPAKPPSGDLDLPAFLTVDGGCDDAVFFATTEGSSVVMIGQVPGLATGADAAGGPIDYTWTLPDEAVLLELAFGPDVGGLACDDSTTAVVQWYYQATSGTVTATADTDGEPISGTMELTDVVFDVAMDGADPSRVDPQHIDSLLIETSTLEPTP